MTKGYDWPPKAMDLLLDLFARGVSVAEMAAALGVTEPQLHATVEKLARAGRLPRTGPAAGAPTPPQPQSLPDQGLRTVMSVRPGECRFPFGEPQTDDFRFCGRLGFPYCPAHAVRCYARSAAA